MSLHFSAFNAHIEKVITAIENNNPSDAMKELHSARNIAVEEQKRELQAIQDVLIKEMLRPEDLANNPIAHLILIKTPQQYSTEEWSTLSTREKADAVFRMLGITPEEWWYGVIEEAHSHGKGILGPRHEDGTYSIEEGTILPTTVAEKKNILLEAGIPRELVQELLKSGAESTIHPSF